MTDYLWNEYDQSINVASADPVAMLNQALNRILRVSDMMQTQVPAVWVTSTVLSAIRTMHQHRLIQIPVQVVYDDPQRRKRFVGTMRAKDIFCQIVSNTCSLERVYYDWNVLNLPVLKVMKHKVRSVSLSSSLERLISTMAIENLDNITVVDGQLGLGYIRSNDVLDQLIRLGKLFQLMHGESYQEISDGFSPSLQNFAVMLQNGPFSISHIMKRPTIFLEEGDDIMKSLSIFSAGNWRYVPVLTCQGAFSGILSDRDMLGFLAEVRNGDMTEEVLYDGKLSRSALKEKTVSEIMQRDIQSISSDTPLWQACQYLLEKELRCLAVYDDEKGFCGILSQSDLIKGFCNLIQMYPNVLNLLTVEDPLTSMDS